MKLWSTYILIFGLPLWTMVSSAYAGAIDVDIPENIFIDYMVELYEGVTLDHAMHADLFDCGSCHHHTTGARSLNDFCAHCHADSPASDDVSCSSCHEKNTGAFHCLPAGETASVYHIDKPGLKGALHLQCLGCHRDEGGPTGCQECHAFTSKGRKRFALEDLPRKN